MEASGPGSWKVGVQGWVSVHVAQEALLRAPSTVPLPRAPPSVFPSFMLSRPFLPLSLSLCHPLALATPPAPTDHLLGNGGHRVSRSINLLSPRRPQPWTRKVTRKWGQAWVSGWGDAAGLGPGSLRQPSGGGETWRGRGGPWGQGQQGQRSSEPWAALMVCPPAPVSPSRGLSDVQSLRPPAPWSPGFAWSAPARGPTYRSQQGPLARRGARLAVGTGPRPQPAGPQGLSRLPPPS